MLSVFDSIEFFSTDVFTAKSTTLLYAIHPKDKKTSYLFGTMHVVDREKFFFLKKLKD